MTLGEFIREWCFSERLNELSCEMIDVGKLQGRVKSESIEVR